MRDLDKALADIVLIRTQIAKDTAFRGLGSATLATTGLLALAAATGQALWLADPAGDPVAYFGLWIGAAAIAALMIGGETLRRTRRMHRGLADAVALNAVEGFLPALGTGICLAVVLARFAPDQVWMLPGLWQVLVGLGLFASARILPRAAVLVGAWYLLAGFAGLAVASEGRSLSPWLMGVPFAVGQAMLAVVMHRSGGGDDAGS